MSRRHLLMLLVLSALWGASFMFIKIGVRELAPTTLICARLALGALTILPLALVRVGGRELARQIAGARWRLLVAGAVNSSIPIVALAWAEERIDSGLGAVLQAASPLFTAVLAFFFTHAERVTGSRLVGLFVGFGGVVLLVGVQPRGDVLAAVVVVGSAFCYAVAALWSARRLRSLAPYATAVGSLGWSAVVLVPFSLAQLPGRFPSWGVVAALLALSVGGTGVAYVLYYALLSGSGASYAILVTYLTPAMALLYGAAFLDEGVSVTSVVGLALILVGVALGTGALALARRRRASLAPGPCP